jgi:regulator of replication initiation timing
MTKKEPIKLNQKPIQINLDAIPEDYALLEHLKEEKNLNSRKDAFHVICNGYRGLSNSEKEDCRYRFGEFCLENVEKLEKINTPYCQACLKAQNLAKEDREREDEGAKLEQEFYELCGIPEKYRDDPVEKWLHFMDFVDSKDGEIEDLKEPIEEKLKEVADLKTQKTTLETDNAFLRQQLDELKKDPLAEKCAWQTVELNNKNEEIKKLKADLDQKDIIIQGYMFNQGKAK